jgi:hypothetical protein
MGGDKTAAIAPELSAAPPALRRRLDAAFSRGKQLSTQRSFDYAHEMFAQCVVQDPSNLEFVEMMLANLGAKFGGDKKKVRRTLGLGGGREFKKAVGGKRWREALRLGIEQLQNDPWHVPTLRALAEACAALHHNEVELAYLKQALDSNPKDADVNRHCARSLARMAQFDQAIACWHRVELIHPGDKEARKMVFQLNEEKILHAAELRELASQSRTKSAATVEEAPPTEETHEELQTVTLSPRQQLEQAIAQDPVNIALYLELSQLLVEEEYWNEAEQVLERCLVACGEDPRVREQLEQVSQLRLEKQQRLAAAAASLQKGPRRIPWLEGGLTLTVLVLALQLVPGLAAALWEKIAAHAQLLLIVGNVLIVVVLFVVRAWRQEAANP